MSVKLTTRQVGDVTIVDAKGRVTLGEGSAAYRKIIHELVAKGHRKILINMGDITYIDSSGIGEMVSAFTKITNCGGMVKYYHIGLRVEDLLRITKLYTVFEVFEDEAAAVRSFDR